MRKTTKRTLLTALMIALIMTVTVSGTLAYLIAQSGEVENVFEPTEVTCEVTEESFDGTVKSGVRIKNNGDVSAYIRAAIVVTWQDAAGNVHGEAPVKDRDYELTIGSDWKLSGNYYYYKNAVAVNDSTGELIDTCTVKAAAPAEGYTLHVEIIAGAIQSIGGAVTVDADGVWTSINNPT